MATRIPRWLLVATPMAVAALANWLWIGRQSLWQDEGVTAQLVTAPWPQFWEAVTHREGNMVGYYMLLWLWPFHSDEAGLRALSALFVVASVPLVFWIGKELAGRYAGFWSASVFALWPFIVRYGQDARSYSLLVLLVVAATAALLKATRTGKRHSWVAYGVVVGLGMYAHLFAALIVLPHAAWMVMRRPTWRHVTVAVGAAVFAAAPMLVYLFFHFGSTQIDWIPLPTLGSVWTAVVQPMTGYSTFLPVLLVLATAGLGVVVLARQRDELPGFALLVTWASLPLLVALGYSLLIRPILQAHYVILITPAWALLLGVAIAKIPRRLASVVAGIVVLTICVRSLQGYYTGFLKPEIREVAALVASQTQPGDGLVAESYLRLTLDYYWRNTQVPTAGTSGNRLWVIHASDPAPPESIASDWRLAWRQDLYHVSVALYLPTSTARR